MPATQSTVLVTRDTEDSDLFHVSGRRVSGRVRASIHFAKNSNTYGIRENSEPEEWVLVHVTMSSYRPSEDDPERLTINGVPFDGYRAVRVNDPWRPHVMHGGHLHRADGDFRAKISDAAYGAWTEVVDQVAALFATDEAIHAARVARARENEAQALADLRGAEEALQDARDALRAVSLAGPVSIGRSRADQEQRVAITRPNAEV